MYVCMYVYMLHTYTVYTERKKWKVCLQNNRGQSILSIELRRDRAEDKLLGTSTMLLSILSILPTFSQVLND